MKKILTTLATLGALTSTVNADIARLELGGGMWQVNPSGTMSYNDFSSTGRYTSKEESESNFYAWMLIKHPIPIIPNLRLEYASLSDKGSVTGSFADFDIPVGSVASANFDITEYDIIPYYNLIDNTFWITLDIGLDARIMETKYDVSPVTGFTGYSENVSIVIPLVYGRGRVEIPATNIGFEADVKYMTYSGSTVYDVRAKVDYTLGFIPVVQPAVELGYRVQKVDLQSDDKKTNMNMEFSGIYAGLMLRF